MTMNEFLILLLSVVAGGLLGALFFGGLWWTVKKGLSSQRPALWFLGSLLVRLGITLGGFYFVSGGHWERMLACLLGFLLARHVVFRITRPLVERHQSKTQEASHATQSR